MSVKYQETYEIASAQRQQNQHWHLKLSLLRHKVGWAGGGRCSGKMREIWGNDGESGGNSGRVCGVVLE